jgi:hypothetical protein
MNRFSAGAIGSSGRSSGRKLFLDLLGILSLIADSIARQDAVVP